MKNKSLLNLSLYMLLVITILLAMCFSYALFAPNAGRIEENSSIGDKSMLKAIFDKNGADFIGENSVTCYINQGKCEIILPKIKKENGMVLGWSKENKESAEYKVGDKVNLTENTLFYAITYSENKLNIVSDELDYLEKDEVSCKVFNKNDSCEVIIPNYNKIGYENRGYSLRKDSLTGTIFPNQTYKLKKNVIVYPIYNLLTRGEIINVDKTIKKYNFIIEVENGCASDVYNGYLNYIDNIYQKANYLLIGSKITFVNNQTFDRLWGKNYMGMNYGPNALRLFDVRCPSTFSEIYYPTIVHELAHTWDFYYRNYFQKNISDENDFINLYSKYQDLSTRPFRDYSYSNIREFFADSIRYYYFKYIEPFGEYYILDYPEDIKKTVEKYICIAQNNYIEKGC